MGAMGVVPSLPPGVASGVQSRKLISACGRTTAPPFARPCALASFCYFRTVFLP